MSGRHCRVPLPQRSEKRPIRRTIAYHVSAALARLQISGQTDPNFLNLVFLAGHREHIGGQVGVRFQKGLFHYVCGQADVPIQFAKHFGPRHGPIRTSCECIIVFRRQTRAAPVLFPLVPCKTRRAIYVGLGSRIAARGIAVCRSAKAGPASFILRPETMEPPSSCGPFLAFRRSARIPFPQTPVGRPTQGENIVVKYAGAVILRFAGPGKERQNSQETGGEALAHFGLPMTAFDLYIRRKFPYSENPHRSRCRRFPALGEAWLGRAVHLARGMFRRDENGKTSYGESDSGLAGR